MKLSTLPCLLSVAVSVTGCNAILGIDDFKDQSAGGSGAEGGSGASNPTTTSQGGSGASGPSTSSMMTTTGPGSGGTGGTGGALPTCDNGGVCIPSVPNGWSGPIAMFTDTEGAAVPGCSGAYPTSFNTLHEGLNPGAATCSCACQGAQGIQCTTSATMCANSNCLLVCNTTTATFAPNTYTAISMTTLPNAKMSNPAPTNVGSCQPTPNHTIPTPTWSRVAKGCGGATVMPTGCGASEVCAPTPDAAFQKICISGSGEKACPAEYPEQHVLHESFTDGRSCSTCTCGTANSTCGGSVDFTSSNGMIFLAEVPAGGCGPKNAGSTYASGAIYTPAPSGTCPPSGGALSGSVAQNGTLTYCCLP